MPHQNVYRWPRQRQVAKLRTAAELVVVCALARCLRAMSVVLSAWVPVLMLNEDDESYELVKKICAKMATSLSASITRHPSLQPRVVVHREPLQRVRMIIGLAHEHKTWTGYRCQKVTALTCPFSVLHGAHLNTFMDRGWSLRAVRLYAVDRYSNFCEVRCFCTYAFIERGCSQYNPR